MWAWAIANPDKVACAYGENPVLRSLATKEQPLDNLAPLAQAGVPLVIAAGSLDPAYTSEAQVVVQRYGALGGKVKLITLEGALSPADVAPILAALGVGQR